MKILLVEDNVTIAKSLQYAFHKNNYELLSALTINAALKLLTEDIALVILDVTLTDGNGFDFYLKNIKSKNIPTIFLTAKDEEDNIVKGLNMGAEDYITKPFSTKELLARVNKIFLRNKQKSIIEVKDISFDFNKMLVLKNKEIVELTPLEIQILMLLFLNINKVVTRNAILDNIWHITGNDVDNHTVTVYLKRIREKLNTDIIKTIKGIGYRIDEE